MTVEHAREQEPTVVLKDKNGSVIGRCVHHPFEDGWRFLSGSSAHGNSRKAWPTAEECIPKWARDLNKPAEAALDLLEALRPFADAYERKKDPGTSDLDDEQPQAWHVPLGAWRAAARAVARATEDQ